MQEMGGTPELEFAPVFHLQEWDPSEKAPLDTLGKILLSPWFLKLFLKAKEETADLSRVWIKHCPPKVLNCNCSCQQPRYTHGNTGWTSARFRQQQLVSSRKSTWIFQLSRTPSDSWPAAGVFGSAALPYPTPGTPRQENLVRTQPGWEVTSCLASQLPLQYCFQTKNLLIF